MKDKLLVTTSPHIKEPSSTRTIMQDVVIALLPTAIAAGILFGARVWWLILVCIASCVIFEYLFCVFTKQPMTIRDGSAIVTGVLLAFNLPSTLPFWMAMVGCFVAIVIVKMLFGGIGKNFANPAISARVVMLVSFASAMGGAGAFVKPVWDGGISRIAGATPLAAINTTKMGGWGGFTDMLAGKTAEVPSVYELLLGLHGGSLGETCAVTLIIGGLYLIFKKVISPVIPLTYIGTVFVLSLCFGVNPVHQVLSGGLILGAFFMATDYATSPVTKKGRFVYAVALGLITIVIRLFGQYVEGVSFAILLMNIVAPLIDRWTKTKPFGGVFK